MIEIFGKIRYHWQPELSWFITYWSIAITPIFLSLALVYEHTRIPRNIFILFTIFVILVGLGFHRYFVIEDKGDLRIVSLNIFRASRVAIADIQKIEVTKSTVTLVFANQKKRTVSMRKWPKKYFLDALAIHPDFKGEVELVDNFTHLDYFELYQDDKKALNR
ncbi:EbsA family protein [Streptococcus cuniculipharyngis]|uniref:EbsA protein n=1 Tax=Streptococcus cuniculipharyngis TaxID=1562651 RepID=A0A5C5SFE1_9STRE|nr:EbsA family protein [Streptococcus cuniculipharyngis]TWS99022.1 EbsA protein [Streptococcus cuniculipharyngis]